MYADRYMHTVYIHKQPRETEDLPALPKARHIVTQRQFCPTILHLFIFFSLRTQIQESSESFITSAFSKRSTRKIYATKNYILIIDISPSTSRHQLLTINISPSASWCQLWAPTGAQDPGAGGLSEPCSTTEGKKPPLDLIGA